MCSLITGCAGLRNTGGVNNATGSLDERPLKILLVGDPGCGKTKLVKQFMQNEFTLNPENDLAGLHHTSVEQAGRKIPIIIYDTPAGQDGANPNKNMYSNADVIILCFDICNRSSLRSVKDKWVPELESADCAINYQFILAGTKKDDRDRHSVRDSRRGRNASTVASTAGQTMSREIKACVYLECSAKTGESVSQVFKIASQLAATRRNQKPRWISKFVKWNVSGEQQSISQSLKLQTSSL